MRKKFLELFFFKRAYPKPVFLNVTSLGRHRYFSSVTKHSYNGARVLYSRGLPHLILRLPSRGELCDFSLRPTTQRVEDLIQFIRAEDRGIQHIALYNTVGQRLSNSDTIESLLSQNFVIKMNSEQIEVACLPLESQTNEDMDRVKDARNLVSQLFLAINQDAHQLQKEKELMDRLHHLKQEVAPLIEMKASLAKDASRKIRRLTWAGLAAMGLQFGLLCRLTWWEYSWDIMEPVTYFIGQSYIIMMFAYYVLTQQEYTYRPFFDRLYLWRFYKRAKKDDFPVDKFNKLQNEIFDIERELDRLRDPLIKRLPLQQDAFKYPTKLK